MAGRTGKAAGGEASGRLGGAVPGSSSSATDGVGAAEGALVAATGDAGLAVVA